MENVWENGSVESKLSDFLSKATKSTLIPNLDYVKNTLVIPPDGGWGWIIVAMSFICFFIIDGVTYTFGLYINEVSETLHVRSTKIALASSLMTGFYFIMGSNITARSGVLPDLENIEKALVIPPDGGWGWVIVAMAFICYFLIDGVMYTFGLFLDEISETFHVKPTDIALATSLMSGFYYLVGPFTCAVTNRYGFRVVGVMGGVISALAFVLSTFFLNLNAFLIFMGVMCGIGFNMIYIPCLLIVGFYFEKWRALATAISLCGSSLGVIAFPALVSTLMKHLHWTWKFRILSGLTLVTSICAFTFRPIESTTITDDSRRHSPETMMGLSIRSLNAEREDDRRSRLTSVFSTYYSTAFPKASEYLDLTSIYSISRRPTMEPSVFGSDTSIAKSTFIYKTDNQSVSPSTIYEVEDEGERKYTIKDCCRRIFCCCNRNIFKRKSTSGVNINRPMYRDDIFYTGSIYGLPEYSNRSDFASGTSSKKSSANYLLSVTRVTTQKDVEETGQCILCPEAVLRTIVTMMHLKLFKSPTFVVLTVSGFFSMVGMYCPYIFLVQRATDMQIDEDWAKLLLTFVGASNTVGRIMCGVLSWFPKINLIAVNYVSLIVAGVSIAASSYFRTLGGQIAFTAIFGFNVASLTVLRSIVVVNLLGLENLTNAFGITSMFFGLGSFIGVPVAGVLQKHTGRYDESFIFAGCAMILSGLLFIPLPRLAKWEEQRAKK